MTDSTAPGAPHMGDAQSIDLPALPQAAREALAAAHQALKSGQMGEAQAAYKRAQAVNPNDPTIPFVMAGLLRQSGQPMPALSLQLTAWRLAPQDLTARLSLAGAFRGARFTQASPAVLQALLALLIDPEVSAQELAVPGLSLLHGNAFLQQALALAGDSEALALELEKAPQRKALEALFAEPLTRALLGRVLLADAALEAFFTTLRRYCLERLRSGAPLPLSRGSLAILALQAEMTAYAWKVTDAETQALAGLASEGTTWDEPRLLQALYARPDSTTDLPEAPLAGGPDGGPLAMLHQRLYLEPAHEARLTATVPRITEIPSPARQPRLFPRWLSMSRPPPRALALVLTETLPHLPASDWPDSETPRILIAGCGTGASALRAASRYAGAQVLALDPDLPSLAYARRQAEVLGIHGITFAQTDLLALPESGALPPPGGPFEVVECMSWLHRSPDPAAGLAGLVRHLAPDGLLRLGFFRQGAQRAIVEIAARLADHGPLETPAALRAARQTLLSLAEDDPLRSLTQGPDFYNLDGFVGLLAQTDSKAFSLADLAELLEGQGLVFLGLEFAERGAPEAFRKVNGTGASLQDLRLWAKLEAAEPQRFGPAYQIWVTQASKASA
ncbi:MAG: hypothetical protein Kilf2KO_11510 [Rhodospirillales bacterium]